MSGGRTRISICIATYGQAAYIEDCVLSVLGQGLDAELEILVGDDASPDGTGELLDALSARHPGRLTVLRRKQNLGPIGNYQDLVGRATGEYIAHLDGDDAWLPGKLRAQIEFLEAHPECPAIYTNGIAVDTDGLLLGPFTGPHPTLIPLAYLAARGNCLMHSSMLYRAEHKQVFQAMEPPLVDYAIHLAFARLGPLGYIHSPLALYRVATGTSMVRRSYPLVHRLLWQALRPACEGLEPARRRAAAVHFAAESLLMAARGRTQKLEPGLGEIAAVAACSRVGLVLRALPVMAFIGGRGLLRRWLRSADVGRFAAEHARI